MSGPETIAALASGQGRAAIAVVRVSGPATAQAIRAIAGRLPEPRRASLCSLADPRDGSPIDKAIVLWFPAPESFTGEDSAELQVHGGRSVVSGLLSALTAQAGVRLAEPGEFARRAFENGKLDLTEVEGLADLIDAETAMQRRQALRQLGGHLGRQVEGWRDRLIRACAWAEAMLDFSDEGDVDLGALARAMSDVSQIHREIADALADGRAGERLRDGLTVVIAGPPNAGKSTLLNLLAKRDAAIVSPIPGTTRDIIEVHFDLEGWPVTLIDTAGIRDSTDPIEMIGIQRARYRASHADVVLWAVEQPEELPDDFAQAPQVIRVRTKADLDSDSFPKHGEEWVNVSAKTGAGIDALLVRLAHSAALLLGAESGLITRQRHRDALADAANCLQSATELFNAQREDELVAEELRLALRALGRVAGRVDVEDVLGALFSGFCIGK